MLNTSKTIPSSAVPIKIGLVQINNSFSGQNYFPYSVGIIQSFLKKHVKNIERFRFLLPIYCRIPVANAVKQLEGAHIIFFSAYVWNIRISYEIAKQIKTSHPETIIVFGGPQVPDRVESFAREHPCIDVCCHGEGEQVAKAILEKGIYGKWEEVPAISFIDQNDQLVQTPRPERIRDMTLIPSPYLDGTFEPLIKAYPKENWIVMWETNRGCPFSCTFCDWGSAIQSKVFQFDLDRICREIDWFVKHKIQFIFCADANFGILPRDLEITRHLADAKKKTGYPQAMSVQNTKNATERAYQVQKTLAEAGLNKGVTVSLQSVDDVTLKSIKRSNISTNSFQELQRRFTKDRIETYSDIILGLPGETYHSFADGISSVIENGQHNRIQFNNLSILPNAEMGDPAYQKKYGMETVESKVVNIHGSLVESEDNIYETQELVIATKSMPREDWVKTRAFSWMTSLLHFDKIFQIPLLVIHKLGAVKFRDLIEIFIESDLTQYPTLSEIREFFFEKARDIQNGGAEFCRAENWLNIWWPADEYIFIKLSVEQKLDLFYREAQSILERFLKQKSIKLPDNILTDAVLLNQSLIKQPFQTKNIKIQLHYNLFEYYQAARQSEMVNLEDKPVTHLVDRTTQQWHSWEEWYEKVVWFGNKKGAYLYTNTPTDIELAGHF
ncbi:MAG: hypothetical protein COV74_03110 [Candidatus Omnitrophica bacterium CG11_big_fil_rev_8_21_14_0_20_45_26]|uniref:Uncharacterized protein n=1 Tax=Candidatus Abzuiibacterium crystallinum TaxID=1974748 RepID=A0A2H0LT40_9BACT|nr:MAG: hypothetical protein COV74_03110 [Candidatus Omnitrophica bacterium CG11_big_fil_rev_8_21_14_0_20_45_26]PIW64664.1 MAG: hypothetical protein COW12_05135 [Candidatus Omnitrophica bacterium CG12_big_fil_rev_8_21_14_0_65_45_16]